MGRLAHALLRTGEASRVIVVVPRNHLKTQLARAFARVGIDLESRWISGSGVPYDVAGLVLTYQQVATSAGSLARHVDAGTLVCCDEIHHCADDASWGESLRRAFDGAGHRLLVSGTPLRTDRYPLPWVPYDGDGRYIPGAEYGYEQAVSDGVCRPLVVRLADGAARWIDAGGSERVASLTDELDEARRAEALRTFISAEGSLRGLLAEGVETLRGLRAAGDADAGGLVVAADQNHARRIAALMQEAFGVEASLVLSDDGAEAAEEIDRFARGRSPWLVAVHMVSEGVDIPRLRVGVYASTVTTETYWEQFLGRFVRAGDDGGTPLTAYVCAPADATLAGYAYRVAAAARAGVRRRRSLRAQTVGDGPGERSSLFRPIDGSVDNVGEVPLGGAGAVIASPAPMTESGQADTFLSPTERKDRIRKRLHRKVNALAVRLRIEPHKIHGTLRYRCGALPPSQASLEMLERREREVDRWLAGRYDGKT